MTLSKEKSTVKNILLYFAISLTLLALAACGGGGGGGGATNQIPPPATKTTAAVTIQLTGTLPAATAISGAAFTIELPANVTPKSTNGVVDMGVVTYTGIFTGSTLTPQTVYIAATATAPGTLKVILSSFSICQRDPGR